MISVTVFQDKDQYRGFRCSGHADYAEAGDDIICAAVSVLTINTVNALEQFTGDAMKVEQDPEGGYLKMLLPEPISAEADLLMKSLVLGLQTIAENYGSEFVSIQFRGLEDY